MTDPAIVVRGLTRRFGSFIAVRDVTFEVGRGEIFGCLGANGAGKSTTIRILCGLLAASSGEANVAGVDVIRDPEGVRRMLGYMSQRFSLYLDLTVEENLAFFGGAYGLFGRLFRTRRDAAIHTLDLESARGRITASLPGGVRQRLALACALLHQPRVLFLDEPTAGVDPGARRTFWRLIRDLANHGTTIFVTTHYMDEAEYCDRVGLMAAGRLAALDTPANLKAQFVPERMLEVHGITTADMQRVAAAVGLLAVEPFGAALHVLVAKDGPTTESLRHALTTAGFRDFAVSDAEATLEDVFLRVARESSQSERTVPPR